VSHRVRWLPWRWRATQELVGQEILRSAEGEALIVNSERDARESICVAHVQGLTRFLPIRARKCRWPARGIRSPDTRH
jgi:hypothetical protein